MLSKSYTEIYIHHLFPHGSYPTELPPHREAPSVEQRQRSQIPNLGLLYPMELPPYGKAPSVKQCQRP